MKKPVSPRWAEAGEERASTGDQRGIDRVCCSRSPAEQSLLLLRPFSNAEVEAAALLRTKEPQCSQFHIWIWKPSQIDRWFCFTFSFYTKTWHFWVWNYCPTMCQLDMEELHAARNMLNNARWWSNSSKDSSGNQTSTNISLEMHIVFCCS